MSENDTKKVNKFSDIFGCNPKSADQSVMECVLGAINFTMFLTLFGQNMNSTDPLETLEQAFSIFDETGSGKIKKSDLEFLLKNIGDRYTQQQVNFLVVFGLTSNIASPNSVVMTKTQVHFHLSQFRFSSCSVTGGRVCIHI